MRISDWSSDVCSSDLLRQGFFKDAFTAQAGAIVGHLDDDLSAMMLSGQSHVALGAFTCGGSHFGQLDAMVNTVAHQVGQGIDNAIDKALVQFGGLTIRGELDLLRSEGGSVGKECGKTC